MIAQHSEALEMPPRVESVEELSLLLPGWQFRALENAAASEGLTIGQYMRRLLSQALRLAPGPGLDSA